MLDALQLGLVVRLLRRELLLQVGDLLHELVHTLGLAACVGVVAVDVRLFRRGVATFGKLLGCLLITPSAFAALSVNSFRGLSSPCNFLFSIIF